MSERVKVLEADFARIRIRDNAEVPKEAGFCFDGAMFLGEPLPSPNEHIALHASFPSNPDVFVRFCTDTVHGVPNDNLLDRNARTASCLDPVFGIRLVRARDRVVGGYHGQELVKRYRESNLKVGYSFRWEYPGRFGDAKAPILSLEMMTGHANPPVNSSLRLKDAMALWDTMLDSIRYREPTE